MLTKSPFVIIDVREELLSFSRYRGAYKLYSIIPLKDLVETILTIPITDGDFYEVTQVLIYDKLDRDSENFDFDVLELFIETLTQILDEKMKNTFPRGINYEDYVVDSWLDNTSVVMRKNEYTGQTDFHIGETK